MTDSHLLATVAVALIAVTPAHEAFAERSKALELGERAGRLYNLGRFEEAIALYEQAYQEAAAPEFLFNIAQAYRQLEDCEHSLFFYKRFLATNLKPELRSEVEIRLRELTDRCAKKKQRDRMTTTSTTAAHTKRTMHLDERDRGQANEMSTQASRPAVDVRSIRLRAEAGVALVSLGAASVPPQFSLTVRASYAISIAGAFAIEPGARASFTPLPWAGHTEFLTSIVAELGGHYDLADVRVGAQIGVGGLVMSQLASGNPFTIGGVRTTGTLWMLDARASLNFEYAFTESVGLAIEPIAISLSPPKNGLREDIELIRRIEILAGVVVRL